jgi:hypothetical protein
MKKKPTKRKPSRNLKVSRHGETWVIVSSEVFKDAYSIHSESGMFIAALNDLHIAKYIVNLHNQSIKEQA